MHDNTLNNVLKLFAVFTVSLHNLAEIQRAPAVQCPLLGVSRPAAALLSTIGALYDLVFIAMRTTVVTAMQRMRAKENVSG